MTNPSPNVSPEPENRLIAVLESLRGRFIGYGRRCAESEAGAAAKKRYDLAGMFDHHGTCWNQAVQDIEFALLALRSGRPIAAQPPPPTPAPPAPTPPPAETPVLGREL